MILYFIFFKDTFDNLGFFISTKSQDSLLKNIYFINSKFILSSSKSNIF